MAETQEYVIRTEGMYNSYGLGKVISPGVALFEAGMYNLTKQEAEEKLRKLRGKR